MVGGFGLSETEIGDMRLYRTGENAWVRLPGAAPLEATSCAGETPVRHSRHSVPLLKDIVDANARAFRYASTPPSCRTGDDRPRPQCGS
jgi:hypothetical protein